MAAALPALVVALSAVATPEIGVEGGLPPEAAALAALAWERVERLARAEGLVPPAAPRRLTIVRGVGLRPGVGGASQPGRIDLRAGLPLGGAGGTALRHEVAHQFLFAACPAAREDQLFHEAFALAAADEVLAWSGEGDPYLPLARALAVLEEDPDLDTARGRRALARLLAEEPPPPGRLPPALARRLSRCEDGAPWAPLRAGELADSSGLATDALVILSRHGGEVLRAEGAAGEPLPFGSTLKPFLLAGAPADPPELPARRDDPAWRCGDGLPHRVDAGTALLRSCNGWFLDWGRREPAAARLGAFGPVLLALGLSRLPADVPEAIGVRPSLRISPLALAQGYRVLAEARPDLVDLLARNAREGTLSGLAASPALDGIAAKTGTVLDAGGRPRLGWIAAVDRDLVLVMARAGRTPRTFAAEAAEALRAARSPAREPARVQVFGLLAAEGVRGRCPGTGVALEGRAPVLVGPAEVSLLARTRTGPLLCAGGPWLVRVSGGDGPRPYAGIFSSDPAPALGADGDATPREQRARRGSDILFRTTRLAYAAGVVAAEDARARGEPRVALARVADANAGNSRHRGRPVCDTTHCQVFRGTPAPGAEERRALARPLRTHRWLPFSRGGTEPWRAERSTAEVARALGPDARAFRFGAGRVTFVAGASDGVDRWEERRDVPCEALRGPLHLPSCPDTAREEQGRLVFEGRGQGHGEGLDVEWASRSGLDAERILESAYGPRP